MFLFQLQLVDYLLNTPLVIEVWGKQSGRKISRKETGGVKNNPTPAKRSSVGNEAPRAMANGDVVVRKCLFLCLSVRLFVWYVVLDGVG